MVGVNLRGVMHGSRAAVEAMREDGGGHILNIASMSSFGPVPGLGVYAATKAGVLSFSASLQGDLDLAGIPIRVHALCPDAAETAMSRGRAGEPDSAILFSAGRRCSSGRGRRRRRRAARRAAHRQDDPGVSRGNGAWRRARADRRAQGASALLRRVGERRRLAAEREASRCDS